jgi:hypothetical protein
MEKRKRDLAMVRSEVAAPSEERRGFINVMVMVIVIVITTNEIPMNVRIWHKRKKE